MRSDVGRGLRSEMNSILFEEVRGGSAGSYGLAKLKQVTH